MTKDGDIIWVDLPTGHPQDAPPEPSTGLLGPIHDPTQGYYCPKRGRWVATQGDNDNQSSLTREKYTEWWEDALADAIKDYWRTPGAM
jgi:hypothetical protein